MLLAAHRVNVEYKQKPDRAVGMSTSFCPCMSLVFFYFLLFFTLFLHCVAAIDNYGIPQVS